MGMFIEPFANSNRLYPHKSKYKNILIYLKHVSAFFLFLIKKKNATEEMVDLNQNQTRIQDKR